MVEDFFIFGIITMLLAIVLSLAVKFFQRYSKLVRETERLTNLMEVSKSQTGELVEDYLSEEEGKDARMSFVRLAIDLERMLIKTAEVSGFSTEKLSVMKIVDQLRRKEIVDKDLYNAFESLWKIRNRVVHGYSVTEDEVKAGMFLGAALIIRLRGRLIQQRTHSA